MVRPGAGAICVLAAAILLDGENGLEAGTSPGAAIVDSGGSVDLCASAQECETGMQPKRENRQRMFKEVGGIKNACKFAKEKWK